MGIPGVGTVLFNNFTISARWGRLHADSGVLRAADGRTLAGRVTKPLEGTTLAGGRLDRHSELRVGGAAGATTGLLRYRSRALIPAAHHGGTILTRHGF